jgi:putative sterol carrier protein
LIGNTGGGPVTFEQIISLMQKGSDSVGFSDRLKFDCGPDGLILLTPEGVSQTDANADCTIKISTENLGKLIKGKLNPITGVAMGKLKVSGNPAAAMKLMTMLKG